MNLLHVSMTFKNAPSVRRRRQVLRADDPSMRRHPVLVQRTQINLRRVLTSGLAFVTAVGIAIGAGLALQTSPYVVRRGLCPFPGG